MSAIYNGLTFDTPLLAQWAAFFDLAGWQWSTGVAPVENWKPDFRATFDCGHSECSGSHTILISVLPVYSLEDIKGHPALSHRYSVDTPTDKHIADAGAVFGFGPQTSIWDMSHGHGSGIYDVNFWVDEADNLWKQAGAKIANDNIHL